MIRLHPRLHYAFFYFALFYKIQLFLKLQLIVFFTLVYPVFN